MSDCNGRICAASVLPGIRGLVFSLLCNGELTEINSGLCPIISGRPLYSYLEIRFGQPCSVISWLTSAYELSFTGAQGVLTVGYLREYTVLQSSCMEREVIRRSEIGIALLLIGIAVRLSSLFPRLTSLYLERRRHIV